MARYSTIAFMIIALCFGMVILNEMNNCYEIGCDWSPYFGVGGVGHKWVDFEMSPIFDPYTFLRNETSSSIDVRNASAYNQTLANMISYKQDSTSALDLLSGTVTFGLSGARIILQSFMFPMFGLPDFLMRYLYFPSFLAWPIGVLMFILMIVGFIEFLTGRGGWF